MPGIPPHTTHDLTTTIHHYRMKTFPSGDIFSCRFSFGSRPPNYSQYIDEWLCTYFLNKNQIICQKRAEEKVPRDWRSAIGSFIFSFEICNLRDIGSIQFMHKIWISLSSESLPSWILIKKKSALKRPKSMVTLFFFFSFFSSFCHSFVHFDLPRRRQSYVQSQLNWFISYRIDLHTVKLGSLEIQSALIPIHSLQPLPSLSSSPSQSLLLLLLLPCMNKLNFSQSVSVKPTSLRAERQTSLVYGTKSVFAINSHGDDMIRELCRRQHI